MLGRLGLVIIFDPKYQARIFSIIVQIYTPQMSDVSVVHAPVLFLTVTILEDVVAWLFCSDL